VNKQLSESEDMRAALLSARIMLVAGLYVICAAKDSYASVTVFSGGVFAQANY